MFDYLVRGYFRASPVVEVILLVYLSHSELKWLQKSFIIHYIHCREHIKPPLNRQMDSIISQEIITIQSKEA